MNERIIELANKANEGIGYKFRLEEAKEIHEWMEKFAELIVKECAEKCESIGFEWHKIDSTRASGKKACAFECAVELKKHFGVK